MRRLDKIKEYWESKEPLVRGHIESQDVDWLIEEVEVLNEIKRVMGLSHADSFNIGEAIDEIRNILEFN